MWISWSDTKRSLIVISFTQLYQFIFNLDHNCEYLLLDFHVSIKEMAFLVIVPTTAKYHLATPKSVISYENNFLNFMIGSQFIY